MTKRDLESVSRILGEENILRDEPMAAHTSFRVGGPADFLFRVGTAEQLLQVLRILREAGEPYCLLGRGTNLLVGDGGYRGCMIALTGPGFAGVTFGKADAGAPQKTQEGRERPAAAPEAGIGRCGADPEEEPQERRIFVRAGAAEPLSAIASAVRDHGLTGFEFAAGIPGSLGGAVVMNAGAYGGSMDQVVTAVRLLMPDDTIREVPADQMRFRYRYSLLKEIPAVVLGAELALAPGDPAQITETMKDLGRRRSEKQPLEYPSAGSTFKRPAGMFAGKLIMDAGLRGFSIGGAAVSEKHCGFVINQGGASAADVRAVIDAVRQRVYEKSGVMLEEEVVSIGEF